MPKKEGRYASGRLPTGPYLMEIIKCVDASKDSRKDDVPAWRLTWRLWNTDLKLDWFLSGSEKVKWAWQDWAQSFDEIPMHVGNIYLVYVEQTINRRNQIEGILAEAIIDA